MTPNQLFQAGDLLSVYLKDYEKLRDEIRMRITQRHQFTNYSLWLFVAVISVIAALVESGPEQGAAGTVFTDLTSEMLFIILLAPLLFYSMLLSYHRHDHYIVFMTVYLEIHIAKPVQALIEGDPMLSKLVRPETLLGWEKIAQSYREPGTGSRKKEYWIVFSDLVMKYSPYLLPASILITVGILNAIATSQSITIKVLLVLDLLCFAAVAIGLFRTMMRRWERRSSEMRGGLTAAKSSVPEVGVGK